MMKTTKNTLIYLKNYAHNLLRFLLLVSPLVIASCDFIGSRKIKSIVELSQKLSAPNNQSITLYPNVKDVEAKDFLKYESYKLTKNTITSEPVFSKGILYVGDSSGNAIAFSIKNKKILWTSNLSNKSDYNLSGGGIAISDDKLYLTNGSRDLITLDKSTGNELIRKEFPDIIRTKPVLIQEDVVLIQTVSNQVFAYDLANAKFLWQHEAAAETLISTNYISPIFVNDKILITYNSGFFVVLNIRGEELWALSLNDERNMELPNFEQYTLICNPIINQNHIYLAVTSGRILKIATDSGQIIWQVRAEDIQSMILNDDNLIITNNARQLAIISTIDGAIKWVAPLELESKKRSKIVRFLDPIVANKNNKNEINILTNDANMYSFVQDTSNHLVTIPNVIKVKNHIKFIGTTCCGTIYLLNDHEIVILNKDKK